MATRAGATPAETVPLDVPVPADLKAEAFAVLAELGITPEEAIRLYLAQIVRQRFLPVHGFVYNDDVQESLRASAAGEEPTRRFENFDDFVREVMGDT